LFGQRLLEPVERQFQFRLRLRVARQLYFPSVGGGNVDVDHLHGGELFQCAARGEFGGQCVLCSAKTDGIGIPDFPISRLNGWPVGSPVNASQLTSR